MSRSKGNTLRRSSASPEQAAYGNMPETWAVEDWHAYYWTVEPGGRLAPARAIAKLPAGYARVCKEVEIGERGCIDHVRRWGFACRMALLEDIGFDPTPLLALDGRNTADAQNILYWMIQATHFDLPGDFIIASHEHPFLLFAPNGTLVGSDVHWYTYLGALAYFVSQGHVTGTFGQLWREDRALYQEAVGYLLNAIGGKDDSQAIGNSPDH